MKLGNEGSVDKWGLRVLALKWLRGLWATPLKKNEGWLIREGGSLVWVFI